MCYVLLNYFALMRPAIGCLGFVMSRYVPKYDFTVAQQLHVLL